MGTAGRTVKGRTIKIIHRILPLLYVVTVALLSITALWSGYRYMIDIDEQYHLQVAYQLHIGLTPYRDFFLLYTPVFHWLIRPILMVFGFSLSGVTAVRVAMILLFILRSSVMVLLIRKVLGIGVALVFLVLYLIDPMTTFSGMQIRPDNVMLTAFVIGLFLLAIAKERRSSPVLFVSGALMAVAAATLMKIVPAVIVVSSLLLYSCLRRRTMERFFPYALGGTITIVLMAFPFYLNGTMNMLVTQVFSDSMAVLNALHMPAYLGDFYRPNNFNLFGLPGRPVTWGFQWLLQILGFGGVILTTLSLIRESGQSRVSANTFSVGILVLVFGVQWLMVAYTNSAFIQYYLPVNWLLAVFAAVVVKRFAAEVAGQEILRVSYLLAVMVFMGMCAVTAVRGNLNRAGLVGKEVTDRLIIRWSTIPEDAAVFPSLLFRPPAHPLGTSGYYELPMTVTAKYPSFDSVVTDGTAKYLILDTLEVFTPEVQQQVKTDFRRITGDFRLYQRIR